MKKFALNLIIAATCMLLFFCKKETPATTTAPTPYSVRLTDAPGNFTAVNIDLQAVELTGNGKAVTLNVNPGIYNLLDFTNGIDTLIATGSVTLKKVQQIRLILGTNNSVVVDSVKYPLTIPSGSESGLKLQVHQELQPGVAYSVLLDFDANQSVVLTGNGTYQLKPVIRTITDAISGAIQGSLSQPNVSAVITASTSSAAYSSGPDAAGDFIIKGLPAGNYTVSVVPASPYNQVILNNISVSTGVTTTLGVINI